VRSLQRNRRSPSPGPSRNPGPGREAQDVFGVVDMSLTLPCLSLVEVKKKAPEIRGFSLGIWWRRRHAKKPCIGLINIINAWDVIAGYPQHYPHIYFVLAMSWRR
jgi:hypothetical protein